MVLFILSEITGHSKRTILRKRINTDFQGIAAFYFVAILRQIETVFGLTFPSDRHLRWTTYRDIVSYVCCGIDRQNAAY